MRTSRRTSLTWTPRDLAESAEFAEHPLQPALNDSNMGGGYGTRRTPQVPAVHPEHLLVHGHGDPAVAPPGAKVVGGGVPVVVPNHEHPSANAGVA